MRCAGAMPQRDAQPAGAKHFAPTLISSKAADIPVVRRPCAFSGYRYRRPAAVVPACADKLDSTPSVR